MEYPPNPTGMPDEIYKAGVDLLTSLVDINDDTDSMKHIEATLNSTGVDSALYLLYYGFMIRQTMTYSMRDEYQQQKDFRTLLQTAASIGAYVSKERYNGIEQLEKLWNITENNNV